MVGADYFDYRYHANAIRPFDGFEEIVIFVGILKVILMLSSAYVSMLKHSPLSL
jgi:hypothetical protein